MELSAAETASKIHFIGGEKGGVGKSMVARILAQFFIDHNMRFVGFDTDRSHGALMRFYSDYASLVSIDTFEALDQIVEKSLESPAQRVLVDLAAQTHEPLVRWMDESGVVELADEAGIELCYWHVMDSGRDSVDLLERLLEGVGQRVKLVIVLNQLRGKEFLQLESSNLIDRAKTLGAAIISIKRLNDAAVQKIDANNTSFWAAKQGSTTSGTGLGLMDRQRVKTWLQHAYSEIEAVGV